MALRSHQSNSSESVSYMHPERPRTTGVLSIRCKYIPPSTNEYGISPSPSGSQSPERLGVLVASGLPRSSFKGIFWWADRAWTEARRTKLSSLREHPEICDDKSLCELLIKEYNRIRAWKGRILSWKSCLGIEFIKFARISTGRDNTIRIQIALPPFSSTSYEFSRLTPEEVHMNVAASELIAGNHQPHDGRGRSNNAEHDSQADRRWACQRHGLRRLEHVRRMGHACVAGIFALEDPSLDHISSHPWPFIFAIF